MLARKLPLQIALFWQLFFVAEVALAQPVFPPEDQFTVSIGAALANVP